MSNTTPSQLEPTIIVVFGVTGDLAGRYLLPALYHLFAENLLPDAVEIIGLSRKDMSVDELFADVELTINDKDKASDPSVLEKMRNHTSMLRLDPAIADDYARLKQALDETEVRYGVCMNRLFYLSIPPSLFETTVQNIGAVGLNSSCDHGNAESRLLVEKPFGHDLKSAEELIGITNGVFHEEQIYRIDHYLAKETVQNIITFRKYNPIFEGIWNNQYIKAIDIAASEKIGIEGRAVFYEGVGALRDLVQSHLLQLLAVTTMSLPSELNSSSIHTHKHVLLQMIQPANPAEAVRGQYDSYRKEVDNSESFTETFASVKLHIDSDEWRDVPVTITTGKALTERKTEVRLTFTNRAEGGDAINQLIFRIQPNEGIHLQLRVKQPGFEHELQDASMDFSYATTFSNPQHPNAYERVLMDAIKGDRTLFATSDEVLASWHIIEPIIKTWSANANGLQIYTTGTNGPAQP